MLFPLITFPYVCRVILADGIGQVNFFSSIIAYITLFTSLGIPLYGVREIARVRNDVAAMNRTTVEILLLSTLLSVLGYVAVGVLCVTVPQIRADVPLFLVLSLTILMTAIGCEWFYQGIEDFKYITIRGLAVRVLSVALLFLFVRSKDDLMLYALYSVVGVLGGNVFNFFRLRRYIHRRNVIFSQLNIRRHVKPVFQVFSLSVVTSIYLQLNPVLLGFMKNALAVGYFTAATRIMMIIMRLSSCLGTVMMPRMSNLLAEKKEADFNALIQKSYDFTVAMSLPLAAGLIVCAPSIIRVFCGSEFAPAVLSSQIIAPIVLMVGISNVMGLQVLYPKGKINIVILCCAIGAVADLVLSLLLIPRFSHDGTAMAYLGAEVATTVSMYLIARKQIPISFFGRKHLVYIAACALMTIVVLWMGRNFHVSDMAMIALQGTAGVLVYFSCLLAFKDEMVLQVISKIKK